MHINQSWQDNSVKLQGSFFNQFNQLNDRSDEQSNDEKHANKECVCGKIYYFNKCFYLIINVKIKDWKKNHNIRNQIRQKIQTRQSFFNIIKKFFDTGILDGLKKNNNFFKSFNNQKNQSKFQTIDSPSENNDFVFMIVFSIFFLVNAIYDSKCNNHLIFDRSRFVENITLASTNV